MGTFHEALGHGQGSQEQRTRARSQAALDRQQRWARAHLPHLPEPYAMSAYEVLRYHLGREPSRREVDARVREQWGEWLEVAA